MTEENKELTGSEREAISLLALNGLATDGAHHKQWFLAEIAHKLGVGEHSIEAYSDGDSGIAP